MSSHLIETLTHGLTPVQLVHVRQLWMRAGIGFSIAAIGVIAALGVRSDIDIAIHSMFFYWKIGLFVAQALCVMGLVQAFAIPGEQVRLRYLEAWAAVLFALVCVIGWFAFNRGPEDLIAGMTMPYGPVCFASVFIFGLVPMVLLCKWLKAAAPTNPPLAGALVGVVSGSLSSAAYALHCPMDHPAYAIWYFMPIALLAAAGAVIGHKWLRW